MPDVDQYRKPQRKLENPEHASTGKIELLRPQEIVARDGRFVAFANRVIRDCYNRLEWLPGPDRDTTWKEAAVWAKNLSIDGGGWRLPTLLELQGLFRANRTRDNISPLFNMEMTDVWSSESHDESTAWGFNFLPGNRFRTGKSLSRRLRVLAVRQRSCRRFSADEAAAA